jgi:hypothetical protein
LLDQVAILHQFANEMLLATWFGPLRQFNLAHPRNVEG